MSNVHEAATLQGAPEIHALPVTQAAPWNGKALWNRVVHFNQGMVFARPEQAQRIHKICTALGA